MLWRNRLRGLFEDLGKPASVLLARHAVPRRVGGTDADPARECIDAVQRLASECNITADAFLTLAAGQGLFNTDRVWSNPRTDVPYQAGLYNFTKRDYVVRNATDADLESLCRLEELCWRHTRSSREKIRNRILTHPAGQFVLEKDGVVLGVLYSQRIASADALMTRTAADVHELFHPSGPIVQLLAVNIDPEVQDVSYGDQLLEFMLQRCGLMAGVTQVVGVTLCKHYHTEHEMPFEEYIRLEGSGQDPVLTFHQSHGAGIVGAVPGYRPEDHANRGNGVLVAYDIANRIPSHMRAKEEDKTEGAATSAESVMNPQALRDLVCAEAAKLLGIDAGVCDLDRPLMEMGLDSADLLKFQRCLEEPLGLKLGAAFFFEHNSLRKVIGYLESKLHVDGSSEAIRNDAQNNAEYASEIHASANLQAGSSPISDKDVAIIGMSCKLPGGIETPAQLWQALATAKSVIECYPRSRGPWPAEGERPGLERGGFVHDADAFDASFFRISPAEAQRIDPQQRILLQLAWACLEDASILPAELKGTNAGVFIGASNCDYGRLIQDAGLKVEAHHGVGSSLAVLANRISYFYDFSGPSLVIDTACSSSLVALHSAVQSLRSGECAVALAGGINLICHQDLAIAYHEAGMLAPDGVCKAFDVAANGYVRAEGAVLLLLKPLTKAVADGDRIHAVIKGSAVNHGGLAGGLTVPNPNKQSELLAAAWKNAGITPSELSYIEAHGTGTPLGDPIEVQGILSAYDRLGSIEGAKPCAIGSVKTNLGHLESAAGVAGVLKVVVSMQRRMLPASINFQQLNPKIHLEDSPFHIQQTLTDWSVEGPRAAGVSSFGSGGANAHVVLREYGAASHSARHGDRYLFVLSAMDAERLRDYAAQVIDWLEAGSEDTIFGDAIYTWQTGRTPMRERLAIKVRDAEELREKLRQWLGGARNLPDLWSGQAISEDMSIGRVGHFARSQRIIDQALADQDLEQLAHLWTSGAEIDWKKLNAGDSEAGKPRSVSLPTYPFAKDHYWIQPSQYTNAPDLSEQRYGGQTVDTLLAEPVWEENAGEVDATPGAAIAEHHVIVCELPKIDAGELELQVTGSRCMSLNADESKNIAQRFGEYALACFERVQSILRGKPAGKALVQIVAPGDGEATLLAGLSGLLKTAAIESRHFAGQIILVPADTSAQRLSELIRNEKHHGPDALAKDVMVRYEQGTRLVQRWDIVSAVAETAPIALQDDGVYLITGGTGGLGVLFASEILAQARDARVVITGRSSLDAERSARIEALNAQPGRVSYRQLDLCDPGAVRELITAVRSEYGRLNGILHCAGMIADDLIVNKTAAQFQDVLRPKVIGTYNLDLADQDAALDFFVLFSSIASATGNMGQADYAAANGFMDQFAAFRNRLVAAGQRSGRTRSINWPLWRAGGMSIEEATEEMLRQATGVAPMRTETGFKAFYRSLARPADQLLVVEGDLPRILAYLQEIRLRGQTAEMRFDSVTQTASAQPAVVVAVDHLQEELKALLAKTLQIQAAGIDIDRAFVELGLDSFLGAELMVAINKRYGTALSSIKLYDYPTVGELAAFLHEQIQEAREALAPQAQARGAELPARIARPSLVLQEEKNGAGWPSGPAVSDDTIAVIGMSGRYPQARNLTQYWNNLVQGKNAIVEVSPSRWDVNRYYDSDSDRKDKTYSKWMGALDDIDCFDPLFFRISPQEAEYMDPQQRLFLEESYRAFEDAGYSARAMDNQMCGVYLGITTNEYASLLARCGVPAPPITSNNIAIAAARIAYFLNLKGPAISIDTACSSSLVATHLACQALRNHEIDMALAGGVTLSLTPEPFIAMSQAGMLSSVGQCKAFDDTADGMVNAEGVGVVVLKRLKDAEADGDNIYGVILGSGINQDGRTNGITAPSVNSQIDLERAVYSRYGIDPETITCVEAHGTGTKLGDPIELEAIATVFRKRTNKRNFCALGSVKSNIGHAIAAAGVAGLQKVLLSMRHRTLAPTLHVTKENVQFDFANSPFYVNQKMQSWNSPGGLPRRAAVSSFGFSGTNAHMVLEEYVPQCEFSSASKASRDAVYIVPLSARKKEQLQQRLRDLLAYLRQEELPTDLMELAYTLQIGREAMEERVGFLTNSVEDLTEKLDAYLRGKQSVEGVYEGSVRHGKESADSAGDDAELNDAIVDQWVAERKYAKLLEHWAKGLNLNWSLMYSGKKPRRISLPSYPFARERYWIPGAKPEVETKRASVSRNSPSLIGNMQNRLANEPSRPVPWDCANYWKNLDALIVKVLWVQLQSLGLFSIGESSIPQWKAATGSPAVYGRWLHETLMLLAERGHLVYDAGLCTVKDPVADERDSAWEEWNTEKNRWLQDPHLKAPGLLLETALHALPEILTGACPATSILFPDSSMELVEGIYKNNPVSDYFNEELSNTLLAYLEERRKQDPGSRIRILEVGAGTGGSTALLLKSLQSCKGEIEEYCYTDISRAFLIHGEKEYGAGNPYLTCRLFNAEEHPAEQNIDINGYDVVIATNVLHATKNIRRTLRHVKAALKTNGLLLLNEMADNTLFLHLTFGLLDGWWVHQDEALRIRGCPGLQAEVWGRVLEAEGFRGVFFPAKAVHALGQQIIVAESDGEIQECRLTRAAAVTHARDLRGPALANLQRPPLAAMRTVSDSGALVERVHAFLIDAVSQMMKIKTEDIDLDAELSRFGFDSISLTGFSKYLNQELQIGLTPAAFFENPTLRGLGAYLVAKHREAMGNKFHSWADTKPPVVFSERDNAIHDESSPVLAPAGQRPEEHHAAEPIAIIGMSGCFPQAEDIDAFWRNLLEGKDCISELPAGRWEWPPVDGLTPEEASKFHVKWGGFIDCIAEFDPLFFGIAPREAELMDPQQRLLMLHVWKAIEDAGYSPQSLSGSNTALLVGTINSGYGETISKADAASRGDSATGTVPSIGPNRMSYLLNLHGPSEPIETACSSSLVAIHRGRELILSNQCEMAIVGGVNVLVSSEAHLSFAKAGMLSEDGRCKAFSAQANGYVRGEGTGILVLKKLSAAERAGDHIYGLVVGSAENHGGRSNSLTAPNPKAQAELIMTAILQGGIDYRTVGYIEAHGTGTALGDPIEIDGLKSAFRQLRDRTGREGAAQAYCGIGSVKTNIGHLELAAGAAGVIKVLLQFQHETLVKSLHCEEINPYIQLEDSPFFIVRENREWLRPRDDRGAELPRRAGVSSFGFGGVNAHVLLEEYVSARGKRQQKRAAPGSSILVLSAKSEEQLRGQAERLCAAIAAPAVSDADLEAVAYTLQVGREAMEHRIAMTAGSLAEARQKLQAFVDGKQTIENFYRGEAKRNKEALAVFKADEEMLEAMAKWGQRGKFSKLMAMWVKGLDFDWNELYGEVKPRRISLPTYPFAKERYWIEAVPGESGVGTGTSLRLGAALHPLLHTNTSDLSEQRYSSTFTGEEFFLSDHRIRTDKPTPEKVLPGVAYVEMARAALEDAWSAPSEAMVLELRNVAWAQPLIVGGDRQVSIALWANDAGQADYEIYTRSDEEDTMHCQGRGVWSPRPLRAKLDLDRLRGEIGREEIEPGSLNVVFARMGVAYGTGFRAITELLRGGDQVLARVRVPRELQSHAADYVLHPSLMDGALQACVVLMNGWPEGFENPRLPFALDTLRILSPCVPEMSVWARYSSGSQVGDSVLKLDMDLCDEQGNICVQMHGFSWRLLSQGIEAASVKEPAKSHLLATRVWQTSGNAFFEGNGGEYAKHHVILCGLPQARSEQLEALIPHCHAQVFEAGEEKNIAERYSEYAAACFESIKGILQSKPQGRVLVQIVSPGEGEFALFAGLSGLLKTATEENPLLIGQMILVPAEIALEELSGRLQEEKIRGLDTLVEYEGGVRRVPHWLELEADTPAAPSPFHEQGVYLITGGLGGVGILFAREILARTRESRVVLCGRSGLTTERQASIDGLSAESGRLSYRQADIGDPDDVQRLIAGIQEQYGRLNGVLHSAGIVADSFILKKTVSEFGDVLRPKVNGAYNLDRATQDTDLDFFVLFSSLTSVIGNLGQADYAVANGFMDHFAAYRNEQVGAGRRSGRTLTINWPLWQDGGMKIDAETQELLRQTTGIEPMRTSTGIEALCHCLALPYSQILLAEGDLKRMRLALLADPTAPSQPLASPTVDPGREDAEGLQEKTQDFLRRQLSGLLKLPSHKIDPQAVLENYGIDSVLAIKMTNHLEKTFGSLSKTMFFEYQTLRELTGYFLAHYPKQLTALFATAANEKGGESAAAARVAPSASAPAKSRRRLGRPCAAAPNVAPESELIAIIGLSGRYPEAVNIEAYWRNLREGMDCIVEVPKERWDWREYFSEDRTKSGCHYSKWGGFIEGVDEFDPLFFNISPKEAELIDPQERLFLQHAWMAIEDAGYTRASLQTPSDQDLPGQVGVYAGVWFSEYQLYGAEVSVKGKRIGVSGSMATIANRVSYFLNLHGPSMTLDTMCSSSLTAIHAACQDLKLGRTNMAIAGGVNVNIHPNKYLVLSSLQAISTEGRCQSFGEGGDGYIPAEGVGVVVLKRLADAQRDGDQIYGVIRGCALNHGGKTKGYTVPNPQAQASVISRVLAESHTDPRHISYVETHGTGTKLGDPIEIGALTKAFRQQTSDRQFCLIGSSKSNIGHCESAAAVAGLTKVLLQMKYRQIVPSLHSAKLNPHIDFQNSPFAVNQSLRAWEQPEIDGRKLPRIAGISSFGAGGSNAHMIVEEYVAPLPSYAMSGEFAILLSARTAEQLRQKARELLGFIRVQRGDVDLVAMAYTLQVGREAMEERLGFLVNSVEQLVEKLQVYVAGEQEIEGAYQGQVKRNREALTLFNTDADLQQAVDKWIAGKKFSRLLDLWSKGLEVNWSQMYAEAKPQRISLPVYPFARDRYWIPDAKVTTEAKLHAGAASTLHALLHRNTSDFSEQRFSSTFTGQEFFFSDHIVKGQRVLPGAAYLEMVRAGVEQAAVPKKKLNGTFGLRLIDVIWVQPVLASGEPVEIHLGLHPAKNGEIEYAIYSTRDAEERIVHSQGRALVTASVQEPSTVDIPKLRALCGQTVMTAEECYETLRAVGLEYGPAHRGIEALYSGAGTGGVQALAKLRLPGCVAKGDSGFVLHPSVMDAALQASIGLMIAGDGKLTPEAWLPFALEQLDIASSCPANGWAWVRYSGAEAQKVDIDICDEAGKVCVAFKGLIPRILKQDDERDGGPKRRRNEVTALTLTPVWDAMPAEQGPELSPSTEKLVIIGGDERQHEALRHFYLHAQRMNVWPADSVEFITEQMKTQGQIDHLLWIVPEGRAGSVRDDLLIEDQKHGAVFCFRLVKALLEAGYGAKKLIWTVITRQTQATHREEVIDPAHASVHGVIGSIAKEYPSWKMRLVDLGKAEEWPIDAILRLGADPQGEAWAYRQGEWLRQRLVQCELPVREKTLYRTGGVYVVIGGAGGVGEVFSEYLIHTYRAQVVWIGRREKDKKIAEKIERLSHLGPAPDYIQADAGDSTQLQHAYEEIWGRFGAVHGVIHSALQLLDKSLWQMDEERFTRALSAKIDTSVRAVQVFCKEELDFVLFFSSVQSFYKTAGQSNYAAGCAFVDAYAHELGRQQICPVKVINWGYWGGVGVVATKEHQERMAQAGLGSIEPGEGMLALERLLANPLSQAVFLKVTDPEAVAKLRPADKVKMAARELASILETQQLDAGEPPQTLVGERAKDAEFEQLLGKLLLLQLESLRGFDGQNLPQWRRRAGIQELYAPWLDESLRALEGLRLIHRSGEIWRKQDGLNIDASAAWSEWESWMQVTTEPRQAAQIRVAGATLRALPEILLGRRQAAEVLFPNSSMELVEGIYKNNALADYFNEALSAVMVGYVQERVKQEGSARLRILEIGAGTGGSSESVFRSLAEWEEHIEEYAYTDVSKAFLLHAERRYGSKLPYLKCRLFDVERSLHEQQIETGAYDVVIAGNVLHATRNIRRTLRHAKALLRRRGILLLNELTEKRLFVHLTFGLTDGWWRFEDAHLRLPGSPSLSPQGWRQVLLAEGFSPALFPAHRAALLGQQIIVAESDGVIREDRAIPRSATAGSAQRGGLTRVESQEKPALVTSRREATVDLKECVHAFLIEAVSQLMKVKTEDIDLDAELSLFGFDSITLTGFSNYLNEELQLELMPSVFFENPTLRSFGAYLAGKHRELLKDRFHSWAQPEVLTAAQKVAVESVKETQFQSENDAASPRRFVHPATQTKEELIEGLHAFLIEAVSQLMKVKMEDIDLDAELSLFGFDSITLTGFSNYLNGELQLELMPSVFFENPTLRNLGAYLMSNHRELLEDRFHSWAQAEEPVISQVSERYTEAVVEPSLEARFARSSSPFAASVPEASTRATEPVAIIGMSGCFPQAEDIDAFWRNLLDGKDCISELPAGRWDWPPVDGLTPEEASKFYVKWGGFIDGVDEFDPLFFGIAPREAELMDPQQRLLMMHVWKAIEDAGYSPQSLSGSDTALLIGTVNSGYGIKAQAAIRGDSTTAWVPSIGPNRMSYLLNLHGPSEPIETACSSSLVAIHRGRELIVSGQCEMAIVGGVNALMSPETHVGYSRAGLLSEDGRCKTFSAKANGYVRGEGAGMLLLKKLSAAERDGDHIYGLLVGSAENHGGRSNSLTAPNPKAQAELIKRAYLQAGIDYRSIGYIEAHGTGTALGDPVEIEGLKRAFHELHRATADESVVQPYCGIGSVKTNIGHLELASGAAGVIKVLLQFRHKTLVKTLHCDEINPYIQLEGSPFYIVREKQGWQQLCGENGQEWPRRAGVSSFGFGGVNAHIVLEEYAPQQNKRSAARIGTEPAVIVLSAKNEDRLREAANRLSAAIVAQKLSDADLADCAYTLQVGREAMEHRIAMVVGSIEEAQEKLQEFIGGKQTIRDFYRGEVKRNKETLALFKADEELQEALAKWVQRGKLSKLVGLWVKGLDFDWSELYGEEKPRRISLPTYPFAKERYWIDAASAILTVGSTSGASAVAKLHPLLHANTSSLNGQRYSTIFTGEEFFLIDHQVRVNGRTMQKILPASAYLEMARAAIVAAWPSQPESAMPEPVILELSNMVWMSPLVVADTKQISIELHWNEDEQIEYEVYSQDKGGQIEHCEGRGEWSSRSAPDKLDLSRIKEEISEEIGQHRLAADAVYAAFATRGFLQGPAFRVIASVDQGSNQSLVQLHLPDAMEKELQNYVLHPSLIDGALQACAGLLDGWSEGVVKPRVPFALDKLRILSHCTQEMFAWVRYSVASQPADSLLKLDIDLCDERGNVCVQVRGLASRVIDLAHGSRADQSSATEIDAFFDSSYYANIIDGLLNHGVSVDEAAELG
ncbi:MAG: SDR family NAD(P)-dependent oxidoreductase [Terracidiphilus sp.]